MNSPQVNSGRGNLVYEQVTANTGIPRLFSRDFPWCVCCAVAAEVTAGTSDRFVTSALVQRRPARCRFLCWAQLATEGPAVSAATRRMFFSRLTLLSGSIILGKRSGKAGQVLLCFKHQVVLPSDSHWNCVMCPVCLTLRLFYLSSGELSSTHLWPVRAGLYFHYPSPFYVLCSYT